MNPAASSISLRPSPYSSSSTSLMDKFLGLSISPASVHSLSSDTTTDANDLDELDEQEIWDVENEIGKAPTPATLAPLPPRIQASRRPLGTPEARSPLSLGPDAAGTSVSSLASPSVNGIGGMLYSLSPASSSNGGNSSPMGKLWSREAVAMSRRTTSASRMIPRMASPGQQQQADAGVRRAAAKMIIPQSAPLNIPDWSKLQGRRGREWRRRGNEEAEEEEVAEEEVEDRRLPPHEFLAREYAKSEQSTSSVLEGAGRTLKGRDLSRVRDAVLTYTGFVEK